MKYENGTFNVSFIEERSTKKIIQDFRNGGGKVFFVRSNVRRNLAVHGSVTPFVIRQPIRRPRLLERVYKPMRTSHEHEETCRAQHLEILT